MVNSMIATIRFVLLLVALTGVALPAHGSKDKVSAGTPPTALEASQLPHFCWAQMGVAGATGPEYKPQACGPGWNHYCQGLVALARSMHLSGKQRVVFLRYTDSTTDYTINGIKNYPSCSIREHVLATKAAVQRLLAGIPPTPVKKTK